MVLRYLLNFILLFISNFIIAQSSELGRFTVNIKKGCIPLEVEIISENIWEQIEVDKLNDELIPFLTTIPLQKLAFYSALEKGYDIDKPRNLAKSVTVE